MRRARLGVSAGTRAPASIRSAASARSRSGKNDQRNEEASICYQHCGPRVARKTILLPRVEFADRVQFATAKTTTAFPNFRIQISDFGGGGRGGTDQISEFRSQISQGGTPAESLHCAVRSQISEGTDQRFRFRPFCRKLKRAVRSQISEGTDQDSDFAPFCGKLNRAVRSQISERTDQDSDFALFAES